MQQHQRQNIAARPSSIDIDSKGLPSPGYNESPYGNGNIGDPQQRGDFRFDSLLIFFMIYFENKFNLELVGNVKCTISPMLDVPIAAHGRGKNGF